MATSGGPNVSNNGLVLSLDAYNRKSTLRKTQSSNILVDPNLWGTGTGSTSGYSSNGSSSEQNRIYINDDPWNNRSVSWRTTPDSTSGADGGWNSSYHSIDTNFTYRWSVWVRRYTTDTGGRFYLGMNPNPIRNDNNNQQGNPYFSYPSISSLTYNQWYLVVGHCFPSNYTGGRHPDSGWWANGNKISDKSFGNVGDEDVRWKPGTTSARHRAYHYYTTNENSGIEFSYPRLDKCDGTQPSIEELINTGESGWVDLTNSHRRCKLYNGIQYNTQSKSLMFDGSDDYVDIGEDILISPVNQGWSAEYFFRTDNAQKLQHFNGCDEDVHNAGWLALLSSKLAVWDRSVGTWRYGSTTIESERWYQAVFVQKNGTTMQFYINGIPEGGNHVNFTWTSSKSAFFSKYIGMYEFGGFSRHFIGQIPLVRFYNRAISPEEVFNNYISTKNRYNF